MACLAFKPYHCQRKMTERTKFYKKFFESQEVQWAAGKVKTRKMHGVEFSLLNIHRR